MFTDDIRECIDKKTKISIWILIALLMIICLISILLFHTVNFVLGFSFTQLLLGIILGNVFILFLTSIISTFFVIRKSTFDSLIITLCSFVLGLIYIIAFIILIPKNTNLFGIIGVIVLSILSHIIISIIFYLFERGMEHLNLLYRHSLSYDKERMDFNKVIQKYNLIIEKYNAVYREIIILNNNFYGKKLSYSNIEQIDRLLFAPQYYLADISVFASWKTEKICLDISKKRNQLSEISDKVDAQLVLIDESYASKQSLLDLCHRILGVSKNFIPRNIMELLVFRTTKEQQILKSILSSKNHFFDFIKKDNSEKYKIEVAAIVNTYQLAMDNLNFSDPNQVEKFIEQIKNY